MSRNRSRRSASNSAPSKRFQVESWSRHKKDKVAAEDECKSLAIDINNHKSAIPDLAEQLRATEERLTAVVRIIPEPLKEIPHERVSERIDDQCRTPWRELCR